MEPFAFLHWHWLICFDIKWELCLFCTIAPSHFFFFNLLLHKTVWELEAHFFRISFIIPEYSSFSFFPSSIWTIMFAYVWTCNSFDYQKIVTDVKLHRKKRRERKPERTFSTIWYAVDDTVCIGTGIVCNLADKKPIWAEDIDWT